MLVATAVRKALTVLWALVDVLEGGEPKPLAELDVASLEMDWPMEEVWPDISYSIVEEPKPETTDEAHP